MVAIEFDELDIKPVMNFFVTGKGTRRAFKVLVPNDSFIVTEIDIQTGTVTFSPLLKGFRISAKFPGHTYEVVDRTLVIDSKPVIPQF